MTTQVSQARIAAVLATAPTWTAARRKSDGKSFFYVPGSNGAVYMTAADGCTCPAAQRFSGPCKHSKAVAQYLAAKAQPAPKPRRTYAELNPMCAEDGCDDDALRSGYCLGHRKAVAA